MGRHLGLIIGVNTYQDTAFRPLQFAEGDARALAQWLVNTKGGKWSPPDVQLVQGQHATRELIESLIGRLCTQVAEPGDTVFIYFAGHSFVDERNGEGYIALSNTLVQDLNSAISVRAFVQHILSNSRADHIVCVLDSFQNGQLWNSRRTSPYDAQPLIGPTAFALLQQLPNRLIISTCRGNDFGTEQGENQLGTFAYRTILGLCGPATDPATGNVTLQLLYGYLSSTLAEQQRPQLFGQLQTPLILVGELTPVPAGGVAASVNASMAAATPARKATGGLFQPAAAFVTPTTPPPGSSPGPSTSGLSTTSTLNEQRKLQCQQMLTRAQQLMQTQNYGEAFNLVEQVLQIAPDDITALTLKGQLLGTGGRFPEALNAVEQIIQREPSNALAWSMRAVLLGNLGQYQQALAAADRSLELDANNPETYGIKNNIMARLAAEQGQSGNLPPSMRSSKLTTTTSERPKENPGSFFLGAGLHIAGIIGGIAGAALLIFTHLPIMLGIALASLALALICVNATRGAFHYGISRVILALLMGLLAGGILGGTYLVGHNRIFADLSIHTERLLPFLFLGLWLCLAAALPLVLSIIGLIAGGIAQSQRRA